MIRLGVLLLLGVAIDASSPAEARCYSRWYYPWPQNCKTISYVVARRVILDNRIHAPDRVLDGSNNNDFPLPDMSAVWNSTAETAAELELIQDLPRLKAMRELTLEGNKTAIK